MKILLIGRTGQLGGDILRNNRGHEIMAPDRSTLDVERPAQVAGVMAQFAPEVVVNCAAFHNVLRCEDEPERAFRVNCVAVRDLARLCQQRGSWFVTFSTDYVFGGDQRVPYREDDRPNPLQIYGMTRLAGEHAALAAAPQLAVVVRTCGLYGRSGATSKGGNFVDNRVADARAGKRLEISNEQIVCPTSTDDLSRAVLDLVSSPGLAPGIYHLTNEGQCSWYAFTKSIYELLGLSGEVLPIDRHGATGNMRRPVYSVLANTRGRALGISLPAWRDALQRYLESRYSEKL